MNHKTCLYALLTVSALWQPSHHYLMSHGISMTWGIHTVVSILPLLMFILFFLSKNLPKAFKN